MIRIKDVIQFLDTQAPPVYQESYDNAGLITGSPASEVEGVLICLDSTEEVIDEALEKGCNLIVAHHPIVFKGLKKLTGKNYVERTIIKAIKNDIAIYATHTNLDNVHTGVNRMIGEKIGLRHLQILQPKPQTLSKLTVFIPVEDTDAVMQAIHKAGAGNIGNYQNCSFRIKGTGTFKPNEAASPTIGEKMVQEYVQENRVEVVFPSHLEYPVLGAMKEAHPYEEVAYFLHRIENENQEVGAGMYGELPEAMEGMDFLKMLKEKMSLNCIRYTQLPKGKIKRVGLCGGAGSFLLPQAIRRQCDAFVSADFKYHEFFDAEHHILIADIGHYESEVFTKDLLYTFLSEKFTNIALYLSEKITNPISYI